MLKLETACGGMYGDAPMLKNFAEPHSRTRVTAPPALSRWGGAVKAHFHVARQR
jgi:hypothetical protein